MDTTSPGGLLAAALDGLHLDPALSLRELDRLSGKTPGHAQALVSGTIADPRASTLAAYEKVLGLPHGYLSSRGGVALPAALTREAAITDARAARIPPSVDHAASDFDIPEDTNATPAAA